MPDDPRNLPARSLDRAALDRVLARAADLQGGGAEAGDPGLTEEQIVELAREVGLSEEHVRLALAEERTATRVVAPETERGFAARLAGPAHAMATRTIRGTPAQVLAALDTWMQREECLQVRRRFPDRMVWEPRRGFVDNLSRSLNLGGRAYQLTRAQAVGGSVVAVDPQRVLVRLDADLTPQRSNRLGGAAAATGLGVAMGALGVAAVATIGPAAEFIAMLMAGGLPAIGGTAVGYRVARGHHRLVEKTQLALEQVIDRLEAEEAKAPLPRTGNPILDVIEGVRRLRP